MLAGLDLERVRRTPRVRVQGFCVWDIPRGAAFTGTWDVAGLGDPVDDLKACGWISDRLLLPCGPVGESCLLS